MNFDDTKKYFINKYSKELGYGEIPLLTNDLRFKFYRSELDIREEEIINYAEELETLQNLDKQPNECSIVNTLYREQALFEWTNLRMIPAPRNSVQEINFIADESVVVSIGTASSIFMNYFRFDKDFLNTNLSTLRYGLYRDTNLLEEVITKPLTIKVFNLNSPSVEHALQKSNAIIEATLFDVAYLKKKKLILREKWERERLSIVRLPFERAITGNKFRYRNVRYNSDLLRFYKRAISSVDSMSKYLSYYHILEYFFIKVSDEKLYQKLSRRIVDAKFSTNHQSLDLLIKDTLEHKKETDETEMLKLVLAKYVDEEEIITVIKTYEETIEENLFTKKQKLFGEEIEVKLNTGHIYGNLAKRIKIVRNALVHSSDRYERNERFIPTAENEKKIEMEIPIMRYLAEKIITNSALPEEIG